MLKIREVIVVEGKYDKISLENVFDALIISIDGFKIYKDKMLVEMLRRLAEKQGLIILTDSDGAGFQIRDYLSGCIDPKYIKHAYVPDVMGKEKRKTVGGKEGKLGVEGMSVEVLKEALRGAGCTLAGERSGKASSDVPAFLTASRFYEDGFSGGAGSAERRRELCWLLGLPELMSSKRVIKVINTLVDEAQYEALIKQIVEEES